MRYPVNIEPTDGGFFVSFPDVPEALTQGETYEDALAMAAAGPCRCHPCQNQASRSLK
jgi:antitoxin HicB